MHTSSPSASSAPAVDVVAEQTQYCGCSVATDSGKLIYAWPKTRTEFDRIPIKPSVFEWKDCEITSFLKRDGKSWQRRVTVKSLDGDGGINVIFQWSEERVAPDSTAADQTANPVGADS